jgi:NAD(P)-dependent dehydrogenase (short-subunit alcohol dehydrogenase family)
MSTSSTGKVDLVTGGASGIGRAIALRLAHDGTAVALFDLDVGEAKVSRTRSWPRAERRTPSPSTSRTARPSTRPSQTPVRRVGRPDDIAAACASAEAGYITGQVLGVSGGRNTSRRNT